ncbi:AAA family ATPase [Streptomyces massasporeus]|uniref:AAA family ATPase n=1 Tax=Streptomyces massasporeus TaxID=67324 RepID=UPI003712CD4F
MPIGTYDSFPSLDADSEAERIAELIGKVGGREDTPWEPGRRDLSAVNSRLSAWAEPVVPRSSLLYWAGHGEARPDGAWLATADSPDPMTHGAFNPESFAEYVTSEWRSRSLDERAWALVVIEACGAQRFVELLHSRLLATGGIDRIAVIGVAGYGAGFLGRFQHVLSDALASYSDNDETIQLRDLVGRIEDRLGNLGWVQDRGLFRAPPLVRHRLMGPITAPLDVYAELKDFIATLSPSERSHFLPKAQGAEQGEVAWYFTGREKESSLIARWLRDTDTGMLVVTGEAGSGKSALLGHVAAQANPELTALLARAQLTNSVGPQDVPPPHVFDAVLHLTGATTAEVEQQLAAALAPDRVVEDREQLFGVLQDRVRPFTVLVDALDEAQEPLAVARDALASLARMDGVRVIVGTRASTKEGPDSPAGEDTDILDALGDHRRPFEQITVDRDAPATAEYVRRRLGRAFPEADAAELDAICEEISSRHRHFLYARLAVHELIARPELVRTTGREQRADLLTRDYRTLFASAADRLYRRNPAFAPLLEALAFSSGRGLPRADGVWPMVARALSDPPVGSAAIDEQAMDDLLSDAAPYVLLDADHGQSVYRLAHRTFQEHYLSCSDAWLAEQHGRIAVALASAAEDASPAPPNAYLVHHLATHVAGNDAGQVADRPGWRLLADRPRLLDQLAPDAVAVQAARSEGGTASLPGAISAICAAHNRLSGLAPSERGALRAVVEAQHTGSLPEPAGWWSQHSRWQPLWAEYRHLRNPGTRTFTFDCERLTAITTITWTDRRTLVALGDAGSPARIRLWDPVRMEPVGEPWAVPGADEVTALAAVPAGRGRGGHDHIVVATSSHFELWDPVAQEPVQTTFGAGMAGASACVATIRGHMGQWLLAYGNGASSEIRIRVVGTGQETTIDVEDKPAAMIGFRHGASDQLLVIKRHDQEPYVRYLPVPKAPVPILQAGWQADTVAKEATRYRSDIIVMASRGADRRKPLATWGSMRGAFPAELTETLDLGHRGGFGITSGPRRGHLLISITGNDKAVTVSETSLERRTPSAVRPNDPSACAVHVHGQDDAFAVLFADGDLKVREAVAGGSLIAPAGSARLINGATGGPLLLRDLWDTWWIWTAGEGRSALPEFFSPFPGAMPFLTADGRVMIVHTVRQEEEWHILCSEAPRRGSWLCPLPDAAARKPRRRLYSCHGRPVGLRVLQKPTGGAAILLNVGKSLVVLDSDRPGHSWRLNQEGVDAPSGAAILHLSDLLVAQCVGRELLIWHLHNGTLFGKPGPLHDVVESMTQVRVGPIGRRRVLLAMSHADGVLSLWDPVRPHEPLADLPLDMAAKVIVSAGSKLCLVNEEGALCIDVIGVGNP